LTWQIDRTSSSSLSNVDLPSSVKNKLQTCYLLLFITLALVAGTFIYFAYSPITEAMLRADRKLVALGGPLKFTTGDSTQFAAVAYDDAQWETMDLHAPPGAHDDDVGISGYVPGWAGKGYPQYAGYTWYRLKISPDTLPKGPLAIAAPAAVDDVYQLYINGTLHGGAGDFSSSVPVVYSVRPAMFLLPDSVRNSKEITLAFRVWMNPANLGPDAGGIHVAPTIGEIEHVQLKYKFQWAQTIKGYIIEVVWPIIFVLLAITMVLVRERSCKWFVTALILLGLMRLNQATYYWFNFETSREAVIAGQVILKPLVLGAWLMAWREWFDLRQPKWLPAVIAIVTLIFLGTQAVTVLPVEHALKLNSQTLGNYVRLVLLSLMLFVIFLGMQKVRWKDWLVLLAALVMLIALFPTEISYLNIIPGIWFPFGVGVSRGQFFYIGFVLIMYAVLIGKVRRSMLVID
jgi:hypothetical protein